MRHHCNSTKTSSLHLIMSVLDKTSNRISRPMPRHLFSNSFSVLAHVSFGKDIWVVLCWVVKIWSFKEFLNAQNKLLHCYCGFPALVGIQETQAHSAGWIDVGMEQDWLKTTDWRLLRIIFTKFYVETVHSASPQTIGFSWNAAFPNHEVRRAV